MMQLKIVQMLFYTLNKLRLIVIIEKNPAKKDFIILSLFIL